MISKVKYLAPFQPQASCSFPHLTWPHRLVFQLGLGPNMPRWSFLCQRMATGFQGFPAVKPNIQLWDAQRKAMMFPGESPVRTPGWKPSNKRWICWRLEMKWWQIMTNDTWSEVYNHRVIKNVSWKDKMSRNQSQSHDTKVPFGFWNDYV